MGRWLALLSLAVLVVGIAAIDPCKRQPFRGRCPSENGAAPKRSQFVLRYYSRSGECVSYPYGHCAADESEPSLYRLKEECEDACIENKPGNLGEPNETYGTIGLLDAKAEGVKIVTQEPLSTTETTITKSTITETVTTTEATTTEKQTEAPTTTTEKTTTVAETTTTEATTTEEVTTQKVTTTEEPSTTTTEKASTTEKVTEAPTTETTTTEAPTTVKATTTTEKPKTTVKQTEAPKVEKKVEATTEAAEAVESSTLEEKSTTAPRRTATHKPIVTKKIVVVQSVTEAATEVTTAEATETTRAPRTECERRRSASASSKIRGGFVPVCDSNGEFEKTQCEPTGEQCFCVDRRGIEVANSRSHEGKPNCELIAASPRTHVKSCGGIAEKGPCSSNLGRWFYSESEKKCMQFIYSGCGGNGNNYDSERDCLARCASAPTSAHLPASVSTTSSTAAPVYKCLKGEPLKSNGKELVSCGAVPCPRGYKCTQQQQTSFCCPEETDKIVEAKTTEDLNAVCLMDKERGPCDKYELRFFYKADTKECKYFFWGGCEGNGNNFVDIDACEQTCGISKARGFTSAPRTSTHRTTMGIRITPGDNLTGTTEAPVAEEDEVEETDAPVTTTSTTTRARPVATTRPIHREPASTIIPTTIRPVPRVADLPVRENHQTVRPQPEIVTRRPVVAMLPGKESDENRCIHPKDSGNCRGQFIRWFYDNQKKVCDVFTYTGCEGNGNNFASREECNAICHKEVIRPVVPDFANVCKHDVDAGECNGVFQRFAFDNESGECRPFTYGGCGGNGNNFATMPECRKKCQKAPAVKPVDMCDNDIEAGQCTGVFTRFGYDKEINDCKQFVYGGCGGNGNNFPSITQCRSSCVKKSCKPTPPCESGRCQLLTDNNGCPFCSCEPTKQPAPPGTNDRCPQFNFADCEEPCLIIKNRRGCQECKCPQLPSTVIPPVAQPPAPHREVAQPPSRPTEVGPPSSRTVDSSSFRGNGVTDGIRVGNLAKPSVPSEMLNDLQEKCMQPVEPGPCTNFSDRWFFNSEDGTCHPFKYGGCAGNRNHFYTQKECEIHCGRFLRALSTSEEHEQDITQSVEPESTRSIEITSTAKPRKHEKLPFDLPASVRAHAVANHPIEKHAELPNIRESTGKVAPYPETYDWHTDTHTTKQPAREQQRERVIATHKELFLKSNEELQELPEFQTTIIQQHQTLPVQRTVIQQQRHQVEEELAAPVKTRITERVQEKQHESTRERAEILTNDRNRQVYEATTPDVENAPRPRGTQAPREEQRDARVEHHHVAIPVRQETVRVATVQHAIPIQPQQHGVPTQQNTYGMRGIESYNPQMNPNLQGLSPPVDPTYFSYNNQNMGHKKQFAVNQFPFKNWQPVPLPDERTADFKKQQVIQNFNQQPQQNVNMQAQQNLQHNHFQDNKEQHFNRGHALPVTQEQPIQHQQQQPISQFGPQHPVKTQNAPNNQAHRQEESEFQQKTQQTNHHENRQSENRKESNHFARQVNVVRPSTSERVSEGTDSRGHQSQQRQQNQENVETVERTQPERQQILDSQHRHRVGENNKAQSSNSRVITTSTVHSEEPTRNNHRQPIPPNSPRFGADSDSQKPVRALHSRNFHVDNEPIAIQFHQVDSINEQRQHQTTIQRPQLNIQPILHKEQQAIMPKRIQFSETQGQRIPNVAAARGVVTPNSVNQRQTPDVTINTENQKQWIYFEGDYYGPTIPGVRVNRPGTAPLQSVDATIVAGHRESSAQAPPEAFELFKKEAASFQRNARPFMHAARTVFESHRNSTIINKKQFEKDNTNENELLILNAPKVMAPDTNPQKLHELPEAEPEEIEEVPKFLFPPPNNTIPIISPSGTMHNNQTQREPMHVNEPIKTLNARPAPRYLPIDNFSKTMQQANKTLTGTIQPATTNPPTTTANQQQPLSQLNIRKILAGPADNTASSEEEVEDEVRDNRPHAFASKRLEVVSPLPVENYSSPTPVTVIVPAPPGTYGKKQLQILPIDVTQTLESMNGKEPVTTQGVRATPTTRAPTTTTTTTTVKTTTTEEPKATVEVTTLKKEEATTSMPTASSTVSETVTSPTLSTILSNKKSPTPTLDAAVKDTKTVSVVENITTNTEKPKLEASTTLVNEIESMESEEKSVEETEQTTKVTAKPVAATTISEKEEREMYISSKFHNEKVLKETDEMHKFEEISLPAKGAEPEVEHKELKKLDIQKIHNEVTETEEYEDSEEDVQETTVTATSTEPSTTASASTTTEVKTTIVTEAPSTTTEVTTEAGTVSTVPSTVPTETTPVTPAAASSTTTEPSTTVSVTTTTTQGTTPTTPKLSTEAPKTNSEAAPTISSAAPNVIENIEKEHVPIENDDSDSEESETDEVIEVGAKADGVARVEPKEDKDSITKFNEENSQSEEELAQPINGIGKVPLAFNLDKLEETIITKEPVATPVPTTAAPTTIKVATTAAVIHPEAFDARVVCSFPADAGSCFNYVTRWFFNSQTGQCEQFSFGQCGGNANNFIDRTTCELKCMIAHPTLSSEVAERCTYDKNVGFGQGYNVKWYFNMKNLRCEQFVYEGQGGNSNQFETLSDCERICTPQPTFVKPVVAGATTRFVQSLGTTTAATEAPTTRSLPSTEAQTTITVETTARPTTVAAPSTESVQIQTTRAAAPPAPETATAQSRQLKPLPDITVNKVDQPTSEEIERDYDELQDKDLIATAVPTLAPRQTTEEPHVLVAEPVQPVQPEPITPFAPQPPTPQILTAPVAAPGTEPKPPAHASKTITIEEIEKPVVQETTTNQPQYTASPISVSEEPTRDELLPIVGKSAVATHNYQTGEVHIHGISTFGDDKLSVEKLSEVSGLPSCPNNQRELRHPNTGAPFMCLPGKNQCPQGSNCYFNGVNFYCCPNIEDPYDKHAFGGYGGEEAKNGYKVFGPLRIRRLMDEVPLRAKRHAVEKRQTSMDLAFNTVPVSFNLDSVIAPLRFDAEKPRSVSRAERMKKPRPPQHGNPMCLLPLIKGDCKEAHLRFFYDRNSDSCRLFYFSGCQGNGNNFGSLEDCQRLCVLGNQPRESYVLAADVPTPSVVAPGQCPTGAPLGGSAPVLCGNSTDSIGCPSGYYCRGGPPDVCCPGVAPSSVVTENKVHGIKQHPVDSASVEEKSVEVADKSGRRGYHKEALLATPKYMCPDASDPLMGSNGEPQLCGTGMDGMKMCPKGFYCAIDAERGSRLCCPLYGAAQRIPAELVVAPYFGRRATNPGEVIGRGSLPSDADASIEVKSREKSTEVPAKNIEFDVTGVKDVPSTSAPTSTSVEVTTKKEAEEDSEEYEDDEEETTKPQRLMLKDNNRHQRLQEKAASESPKASDVPAETSNIDVAKETATPVVEETPAPTKIMEDKSICHIKPNEGRACRADEKAPRTNLQYFYSAKDNRCKLYFYKGCGGTDNRFEKKADCEALCLRK